MSGAEKETTGISQIRKIRYFQDMKRRCNDHHPMKAVSWSANQWELPRPPFAALRVVLPMLWILVGLAAAVLAADPGTAPPASSPVSDQKPGSVLVYPYYNSSVTPATTNTRIALTNLSATSSVIVRLFFSDQSGHLPSSNVFLCLTPVQTTSFLASDVDPGIRGFIVAIAVDNTGRPINFNFLAGEADIKLNTGQRASLKAEAIAAVAASPASVVGATATLLFDGTAYNRLPRTVAIDRLRSAAAGNSTLLILTRITGNYSLTSGGINSIGDVTGRLIDEFGNSTPFTFTQSSPQLAQTLSNSFPVTTPPYTSIIPANSTGWLKLWGNSDIGLFGAVLNFNSSSDQFSHTGGHHLRHLTLSTTNSISLTMVAPTC